MCSGRSSASSWARCARRSRRGEFEELDGGRFRVTATSSSRTRCSSSASGLEGWAVASEDGITVALDTALDDELRLEARVNDLIRDIQNLRKASGLEIVDRIRLWIADAELLPFAERIAAETLAVSVELGDELRLEKA